MPVEGFPDASKHKICIRCRRWFEPEEGEMAYPEAGTGFSAFVGVFPPRYVRILIAKATGSESKLKFVCRNCLKRARRLRAGCTVAFCVTMAVLPVILFFLMFFALFQ